MVRAIRRRSPTEAIGSLTFVEATSLMVGAGVGAGIMAVPYLAARTGFAELLGVTGIAFGANCLIHLMLAEVAFRTPGHLQVIELMRIHLFTGRSARLVWAAFGLLTLAFVAVLAAYIAGGSEIVSDLTGMPATAADLAVYAASAAVVFFGLKAVGVFENLGALVLIGIVGVIAFGSIGEPVDLPWEPAGGSAGALALFGMVMYALYTFYTVPQVVKGLAPDHRAAVRAIVTGLGINALLIAGVASIALSVSDPVTEVAIVGIAKGIGGWAATAGSIFVLVALVTSYWSVSLALADVLVERVPIGRRVSWVLATLPSLGVLLVGGWRFLDWLRLAGGITALVVVLVTVPMYRHARAHGETSPWTLGPWGSGPAMALVVAAAALMAVGSLLQP